MGAWRALHDIRLFEASDRDGCLAVFDENCPEFFAPNERTEYAAFLDQDPDGYWVCLLEERIAGAFGLRNVDEHTAVLNWILLARTSQGRGLGAGIMKQALQTMRNSGRSLLRISASQHSAPFFAKFGAIELSQREHGWGPGMHRVELRILV
jgi:GNAT superfamily N-acetyltransferase